MCHGGQMGGWESTLTGMQIEHLTEQLFFSYLHGIDKVRLSGEVTNGSNLSTS